MTPLHSRSAPHLVRLGGGLVARALFSAFLLALLLAVLLGAAASAHAAEAAGAPANGVRLRRFALMTGFNDGGPTRPRLRYAASDARAMSRVLESLGGIAGEDLVFVSEASRAAFLAGFDVLVKLVSAGKQPGVRREVFVYYSGHSDEEGLLIGSDRVSYDELRARIQTVPAEVRLAILDSCASGAFTRRKGGVRRAPFLLDGSADTKGHAYLTSSAINEVAQESDRIGASFFTHYLVSGLRGAADINRDRRVTLQEAFQFAAQETLARTERTRGGPQHAAYEFDLVGTSELVVTDVRSTQATLALAPELAGRIGVRDGAGNLVVELRKVGGHGIELGLEAGPYLVTMDGGGTTSFEANVTLALGQRAEVARLSFHPGAPLELVATRGDGSGAVPPGAVPGVAAIGSAPAAGKVPLRSMPVHLGLVPMPGDGELDVHGLSFGFVADRVGGLSSGLQLSLGANMADQYMYGTQLTVGANILRGPGRGAQIAAGVNYAAQSFRGAQLADAANVTLGDFSGAQLAAGANWVEGSTGGAQLAAGFNLARAGGRGAQFAGGLNLALGQWRGLQVAGGLNLGGEITGAQLAPFNFASNVQGLQLGVVNVAGESAGAQVSVVNVARRSRGFNVGVINIAREHDGETFGLINIIGNGIHDVAAYATESMLSNVELKLGSRRVYTSFIFAYQPGDELVATATPQPQQFQRGSRRFGLGLGVGFRQPLDAGRLRFLEIEVSSLDIQSHLGRSPDGGVEISFGGSDESPILASARAIVGVELARGLMAIGGLSMNAAIGWNGRDANIGPDFLQRTDRSGQTTVRQYPGLLLGLEI
ncbi:MAG TPA: caspase family protein [Polyangia bacterium]|nr:caspase family protein [Polyangia bacterium]